MIRYLSTLLIAAAALCCPAGDHGTVFFDRNGDGVQSKDEAGLPGIRVSNGSEIVLTDSKGNYKFSSAPAMPWVCVITPEGYRHTGSFWSKPGSKGSFGLKKDKTSSKEFTMLHGADIQYNMGKQKKFWQTQVREFSDIIRKNKAELLVCVGDLTPTGTVSDFSALRAGLKKIPAECRMIYGGHDRIQSKSPARYIDFFGPLWYSWNFRGVHFVALMSELTIPKAQQDMQWNFLKADLSALPPGTPTVLLTHVPSRIERNIKQLLPKQKFELVLMGHYHEWGVMPTRETTIICSSPWREGDCGAQTHKVRLLHRKNGSWSSETVRINPYRKVSYKQSAAPAAPVKGSWPGHLGANGSRYTAFQPSLPLQRRWIFDLKKQQDYHSSPVLADGKIYISIADGNIHAKAADNISGVAALDAASGKLLWKFSKPVDFYAPPVVAGKRIFAVDSMGSAVALDRSSGKLLWTNPRTFFNAWRFQLATVPLLVSGNRLFVHSYDGLRGVNTINGRRLWRNAQFSENPACQISIGGGRIFVFGQFALGAFDQATGKQLWFKRRRDLKKLPMKRERGVGGSIAIDGKLFVQSRLSLRKFDFDGNEIWAARIESAFNRAAAPAVSPDKVVVASGKSISAYDRKTGKMLWKTATGNPVRTKNKSPESWFNSSSPAIAGNMVICGADSGRLLVIDLNSGKILQRMQFESPIKGSVAVGDNFVCVMEHSGKIHGLSGSNK